jgi:serine/threonine protein phosphatase PrpC
MVNPGQQVCLFSSARTDTGRVRSNNEDSIHLWTNGDHVVLAVVADGMGGAVAGEEASRIAVETIHAQLSSPDGWQAQISDYSDIDPNELVDRLQQAISGANETIVARAAANPELKGMGTTVTLAFVHNTEVVIGHVGDSRAYLIDGSDGYCTQVTADHTLVQALVDAGHISQEEAESHPMKNVLYRALGQSNDVDIDIYFERMHIGDRLILCSDGLTLHVEPEEIAQLAISHEPVECSQKLIDLAKERGGHDNISVVVIKVEKECAEDELQAENVVTTKTVIASADGDGTESAEPQDAPQPDEAESQDAPPPDGTELPDVSPPDGAEPQASPQPDEAESQDAPPPDGTELPDVSPPDDAEPQASPQPDEAESQDAPPDDTELPDNAESLDSSQPDNMDEPETPTASHPQAMAAYLLFHHAPMTGAHICPDTELSLADGSFEGNSPHILDER